jgi:hypothetical protein
MMPLFTMAHILLVTVGTLTFTLSAIFGKDRRPFT